MRLGLTKMTLKLGGYNPGLGTNLLSGLVGYWALNEASGTRNDSVGSNHLTDLNTVGTITGPKGGGDVAALFVRANSEGLQHTYATELDFGQGDWSLSLWGKVNTVPGLCFLVDLGVGGVPQFATYADLDPWDVSAQWYNAGWGYLVANSNLSLGVWHHVVWTHTAASLTVTLRWNDSASASSNSVPYLPAIGGHVGPFSIGRTSSGGYFDGAISRVAKYNRVLSTSEITKLYGGGSPPDYPFP